MGLLGIVGYCNTSTVCMRTQELERFCGDFCRVQQMVYDNKNLITLGDWITVVRERHERKELLEHFK